MPIIVRPSGCLEQLERLSESARSIAFLEVILKVKIESNHFWQYSGYRLQSNPEKCMKARATQTIECIVACLGIFLGSSQIEAAQEPGGLPYMDPQLSPEQRATDLGRRMTLQEKATQMQNNSAAVPRLKVPAYQWWSEALHGVINQDVTEYPEPIGLAATFDAPGIHTMAAQIGIEGRIKHVQNAREGHSGIMGGLDFWSPNLNIFRDPRWGRGQETYGEDPFLTGRMGVAYVTRSASGYVLQGCRPTAQLRRLRNGEPHVPLLQRQAAVSIWLWVELYEV